MKVLSYLASLLFLYLMVQVWSSLWDICFLLPVGIVVTVLTIVMVILVTAEDRKKARSDRIFEEMSDHYEREQRRRGNLDE